MIAPSLSATFPACLPALLVHLTTVDVLHFAIMAVLLTLTPLEMQSVIRSEPVAGLMYVLVCCVGPAVECAPALFSNEFSDRSA